MIHNENIISGITVTLLKLRILDDINCASIFYFNFVRYWEPASNCHWCRE